MSSMALRCLLRRIPGPVLLRPSSGPRMGPVHGASPAGGSRFVGTQSQSGRPTTLAEIMEVERQEAIKEWNKLREKRVELWKDLRRREAEHNTTVEYTRKVDKALNATILACSGVMIIGINYRA